MASSSEKVEFDSNELPHRRFNPLLDEWVLVSPHRMKRPWSGQVEKPSRQSVKRHDPNNPLCPGVTRPNGETNPNYTETYVFNNDFPALFEYDLANSDETDDDLFKLKPARGVCKVVCFHPYSDLTLSTMQASEIVKVIQKWIEIYKELSVKFDWVQIFENKGEINGCSNPHPHCQVWACDFLPNQIATKNRTQRDYYNKHGGEKVMLLEYARQEMAKNERVVAHNEHWLVVVPYWAVWPYETMILPKQRHIPRMDQLTQAEIDSLADIMKRLLVKYDNLFKCSFPYSMGFHFAPSGQYLQQNVQDYWQFHACYLPPLLRSATVRKFMVGFELMAQAQRDLTPERAAVQLRELSDSKHYLEEFVEEN